MTLQQIPVKRQGTITDVLSARNSFACEDRREGACVEYEGRRCRPGNTSRVANAIPREAWKAVRTTTEEANSP